MHSHMRSAIPDLAMRLLNYLMDIRHYLSTQVKAQPNHGINHVKKEWSWNVPAVAPHGRIRFSALSLNPGVFSPTDPWLAALPSQAGFLRSHLKHDTVCPGVENLKSGVLCQGAVVFLVMVLLWPAAGVTGGYPAALHMDDERQNIISFIRSFLLRTPHPRCGISPVRARGILPRIHPWLSPAQVYT